MKYIVMVNVIHQIFVVMATQSAAITSMKKTVQTQLAPHKHHCHRYFLLFFFLQIALSEYEIANYVVCVCFFFMNRDVPSMHVLMSQLATVMLKYVMGTTNVPMASMNMVAKVSPKDLLIPRIIE